MLTYGLCSKWTDLAERLPERDSDDIKCQQKNGYSELLFELVSEQNKRRISVCTKSYEYTSDKQNRLIAGCGRLYCVLDQKSGRYDRKAEISGGLCILFSIYSYRVKQRYRT